MLGFINRSEGSPEGSPFALSTGTPFEQVCKSFTHTPVEQVRKVITAPALPISMLGLMLGLLLLGGCTGLPQESGAPASSMMDGTATPSVTSAVATDSSVAAKTVSVVVQFDRQTTAARTVAYTETISGLDALLDSGLEVATADFDWGTAVCSIESVGCPADDCFCDDERFWAYQHWDGTEWQAYETGAASTVISQTGTVEGWHWTAMDDAPLSPAPALSAEAGLHWLRARQTITDGGYGGLGASVEVMLSIGANRIDARTWRAAPNSPSLYDYVLAQPEATAGNDVAATGKLAVALGGSMGCRPAGVLAPHEVAAMDGGVMHEHAGPLAWAILGEVTLTGAAPPQSVAHLAALAAEEGGWEWSQGWGTDTNTTALAIQALLAAGHMRETTEIEAGLSFLKRSQNQDGGFTYDPDADRDIVSDANSTAYVVQALLAAGEDPAGTAWNDAFEQASMNTVAGNTPIDFLLDRQQADGGFAWQEGQPANQAATQQVIPALLGRSFPLAQGPAPACEE